MLMNDKSENHWRLLICETEGSGFNADFSLNEHGTVHYSASEKKNENRKLDILNHVDDVPKSSSINLSHGSSYNSSPMPSEIFEEDTTSDKSLKKEATENIDIDLIKDADSEIREVDVERVIEKQNTHDFYCPNCNSCITRRVILRKRKRKIGISNDVKHKKLETGVDSEFEAIPADETDRQAPDRIDIHFDGSTQPAENVSDRDREPDIFRCLSCFSFFIPTAHGFKLFRFGRKYEQENLQIEQIPVRKRNWFSSIFSFDKGKMSLDQGIAHGADVKRDNVNLHPSSNLTDKTDQVLPPPEAPSAGQTVVTGVVEQHTDSIFSSSKQRPDEVEKVGVDIRGRFDDEVKQIKDLKSMNNPNEMLPNHESKSLVITLDGMTQVNIEERTENPTTVPQQDGLKFIISGGGSPSVENMQTDQKVHVAIQKKNADEETVLVLQSPASVVGNSDLHGKVNISSNIPQEKVQNLGAGSIAKSTFEKENEKLKVNDNVGASKVCQHYVPGIKAEIQTEEQLKLDRDAIVPSVQDSLLLQDAKLNIDKDLKNYPSGIILGQVKSANSQRPETEGPSLLETRINVVEQKIATSREFNRIEIIKSIVYGGLLESVTSLGVVSSAAGSNAATLNVLALGLANVIGGLFIIGHNLLELKDEPSDVSSNQVAGRVDWYRELLGRRENFLLHAIVAVLSFLLFGLVPPIIYGFSFSKSDDRGLKLTAVAAASFLSIIILAIGKVYSKIPPRSYVKAVVYYVAIGLAVSGISYVAGDLMGKLLEKLGFFQSSSVVNLSLPETRQMGQAWASY